MDHVKQLIIPITIILLFYRPVSVNAELIDISQHSGIIRDSTGSYKTINGRGTISSINTGTQLTVQNKVPFPTTTKGNQYVDINRTVSVDLLKVGAAAVSMIKRLSPAAMTIGAVAYICETTGICDQAGEWFQNGDPAFNGYPLDTLYLHYEISGAHQVSNAPTMAISCERYADLFTSNGWYTQLQNGNECWVMNGEQVQQIAFIVTHNSQCADNYSYDSSQGKCIATFDVSRPVTDQDLSTAEPLLNTGDTTPHLVDNSEPVPVDVSTPPSLNNAPITKPVSNETTTTKDGQGNTTGTQTTETSLEITDAATTENPNQLSFSETTTVTNYDINNNITNQTITETSVTPPAPPEAPDIDYQIKFDDVTDNDLEDYEFPAVFATDSWGTGSCPADRSVSYSHGSLELTYQPVCEFAEGIKPAVLVIAGLSAMFIVSGVRTE